MKIAVLYEHPTWSAGLFERMKERGIETTAFDVGDCSLNTAELTSTDVDLWVNRVNAMPSQGRSAVTLATAGHLLLALEAAGQPVYNGHRSFAIGGSKVAQSALFTSVGAATPEAITVTSSDEAVSAADRLGYPLLTKPNIGGSGRGIARYDSAEALQAVAASDGLDLGLDGTGLVQKAVDSADGVVHRIEVIGGELFYATEQATQTGVFNYCAVDGCGAGDSKSENGITLVEPDGKMLELAIRVADAAGADVAGVEYLIGADDGEHYLIDFNPYSNFVVGFDAELGFRPDDRYIDGLLTKAAG